jgi:hypothetical protein
MAHTMTNEASSHAVSARLRGCHLRMHQGRGAVRPAIDWLVAASHKPTLRGDHTPGKRSVSLSPPSGEPLTFRPEPAAPPAALATRGSQPAEGCGYRSRYIA